ncbi:MAG TPA: TerD family protein, partial [Agitococcus sp.]|nr:TerD family protein [Agitococcus sp.]
MLLKKQETINLSKSSPNLKRIRIGLGWDAQKRSNSFFSSGFDYDLDVSVFVCTLNHKQEPKLISDEHFV